MFKFMFLTVFILSFVTHQFTSKIQTRDTDLPGAGHDDSDFVNAVDCTSSYLSPSDDNGDVIPYDRWRGSLHLCCTHHNFVFQYLTSTDTRIADWVQFPLHPGTVCNDVPCLVSSCTGKLLFKYSLDLLRYRFSQGSNTAWWMMKLMKPLYLVYGI